MKHLQFAIASIVDANTGFGLHHGGGKVDYEAEERAARTLRSRSVHAFFGAIGGIVRDAVAAHREKARQRRALEELSHLNDHFLEDIGLTRGDIAAVRLGHAPGASPRSILSRSSRVYASCGCSRGVTRNPSVAARSSCASR